MNYTIIEAMNQDTLIKRVNESIERGFIPQGGICFNGSFYYQAMIKK